MVIGSMHDYYRLYRHHDECLNKNVIVHYRSSTERTLHRELDRIILFVMLFLQKWSQNSAIGWRLHSFLDLMGLKSGSPCLRPCLLVHSSLLIFYVNNTLIEQARTLKKKKKKRY